MLFLSSPLSYSPHPGSVWADVRLCNLNPAAVTLGSGSGGSPAGWSCSSWWSCRKEPLQDRLFHRQERHLRSTPWCRRVRCQNTSGWETLPAVVPVDRAPSRRKYLIRILFNISHIGNIVVNIGIWQEKSCILGGTPIYRFVFLRKPRFNSVIWQRSWQKVGWRFNFCILKLGGAFIKKKTVIPEPPPVENHCVVPWQLLPVAEWRTALLHSPLTEEEVWPLWTSVVYETVRWIVLSANFHASELTQGTTSVIWAFHPL